MYLSYSVVFGLMRGVKVRTAFAIGEGRPEDARRYALAGVLLAAGSGLVVFVLARDATPMLELLRVDPALVPFARDFLAARTTGALATCTIAALTQYRQGLGDSRTPMLVGLGGNMVNVVLAYSLIHGKLGLPALGVRGAGYGTAITEFLEAAALIAVFVYESRREGAKAPNVSFRQALREVTALGAPSGLHFGFETLAFTTFTALLASMGAAEMAAHHIALNTLRASFLPGFAVSEAATVLVARNLGARNLAGADQSTRSALLLGVSFMTACGLLFALAGAWITRIFSEDPTVVVIARRLFIVAAVFQVFDAINMVLRGALRGAKDVHWVAVVGTTIVWVCVPGAAWILGRRLGMGALGGWFGFVLETTLGATVMWFRWTRGPWRAEYAERERPEPDSDGLVPLT
jgi:MATE family multidrug resistance protein